MSSLKSGYETVLFFENQNVIRNLQEHFNLYKDKFPVWAGQSNGMNLFIVWHALQNEGLGASLRHCNEIIREEFSKEWEPLSNWIEVPQVPFGTPLLQ